MALSPMMMHYLQLKEKYKDEILLYRLGDFYECFYDDAKIVSKELELVLTGKSCGLEERAPMCGVPAHAVDSYLSKLVQQGFRVAICEQLTEPEKGKMVERDVVRVISAGTAIEEDILTGGQNNYLACVYVDAKDENKGALAYVELSTGEFNVIDVSCEHLTQMLNDELIRIHPVEIICNATAYEISSTFGTTKAGLIPNFEKFDEWSFDEITAKNMIQQFYGISNVNTLELSSQVEQIKAVGAVLEYLKQTQKRKLNHIKRPHVIHSNNFLYLDASTIRNLELTERMRDGKNKGTLLSVLDYTKTNAGARCLKRYITQPLQSDVAINKRLDSVEELVSKNDIRISINSNLDNFSDIERICTRLVYGSITPKECIKLKISLSKIPALKSLLQNCSSESLKEINSRLIDMSPIVKMLEDSIVEEPPVKMKDGGFIKAGYNKELDEYRDIKVNGTKYISRLQQIEIEQTEIKNLKIKYNKVFGYFIEVPQSMVSKVPLRYVRKQTVANCERYITDELKEIEDKILNAEDKSITLENELYNFIKEQLMKNLSLIQDIGLAVAELDVFQSFAIASEKNSYVRPNISKKNTNLEIVGCRHPVVEKLLQDSPFVANDVNLNNTDERIMIITGPNMAGKSTYMREIALCVLMAHIGCFVPAKSAIIPIIDRIFTRVGASDDLSFGQSTFMVEMMEVANILNNATENSLIILDEVGRGTSTYDGLSIAWAIMDYLSENLRAKTLFATHYFELTDLEGVLQGVKNYKIVVKEYNDEIIFLRKIVRGGANKSFGIQVAALAGVPKIVTDRAKEILKKLELSEKTKITVENSQDIVERKENSKIEEILKNVDINNTTPLQAMEILTELIGCANKE